LFTSVCLPSRILEGGENTRTAVSCSSVVPEGSYWKDLLLVHVGWKHSRGKAKEKERSVLPSGYPDNNKE
jgi:hypothetical protein